MSSSDRTAAIALLVLLLAACQPLPRPLADLAVPGPELLAVPGSGGIAILEVEGLAGPRSEAFTAALAEALEERDVPATAGSRMRRSHYLLGRVETREIGGDGLEIDWDWELVDERGNVVDRRQDRDVMMRQDWQRAGPKQLARRAAPTIVALYNGQMPAAVEDARPTVFLAGLKGAPGDGGRTLPRALATAIEGRQITATTDRAAASAIVDGTMSIAPAGPGKEKVEIRWRVSRPNDEEVGVVTQANEIPAGSLKGAWGEIAGYVALAAADGIADLVQRIPRTAARPRR